MEKLKTKIPLPRGTSSFTALLRYGTFFLLNRGEPLRYYRGTQVTAVMPSLSFPHY
jgi:hypothetical protein